MLFSILLNIYLNHYVNLNIIVQQLRLHLHCTSLKCTFLKIIGYEKRRQNSYSDGYLAQLKIYCLIIKSFLSQITSCNKDIMRMLKKE